MYWEHFLRDICIHIYTYRTSLHDHTNDRSQHGLFSDRHDERMWYVVVRRLSHMWSAMRWRATPLACFLHTLHPPPNSQTCRTPGIHTYAYVCIYNNVALPPLRGPHSSFCCHYYCVSHPAMCSMMSESLTKSMTTSTLKQTFPKAGNQGEPKQWGSPSCARARSLLAPSSVPASPTRLKSINCCYGLQYLPSEHVVIMLLYVLLLAVFASIGGHGGMDRSFFLSSSSGVSLFTFLIRTYARYCCIHS